MSRALTKRQQQILNFITAEVAAKGYPPSVREIGLAIGLSSSSTVHSHLTALEKKGHIKRDPSKPRALLLANRPEPTGAQSDGFSIPVVGRVAAGEPILAEQNIDDHIVWPRDFSGKPTFALQVKGDSMTGAGILDGDLVMVRRQESADNGEIVVALIDDEATVKYFFREPDRVRLEPANKAYSPIYSRDAVVVGKVVGLLRRV